MAVAKSALSSGGAGSTNGVINGTNISTTSQTVSTITIGASDTTCLIFIVYNKAATTTGWTVKLGSQTASLISGSSFNETLTTNVSVIAFEVKSPTSGSQNVTALNTGFSPAVDVYVYSISFTGSDTSNASVAWGNSTSTATTTASTGASSFSIPSTDMAASMFGDASGVFGTAVGSYGTTGGASLTFIDADTNVTNNSGATYCTGTAAVLTMTATQGSDGYVALGVHVGVPASGTTLGSGMPLMFI